MAKMDVRSIYDVLKDEPWPPSGGFVRKTLWAPEATDSRLNVDIYALRGGGKVETRYHPDHMAMVICWQGSGEVTIAPANGSGSPQSWGAPYYTFNVGELDTFIVPKGALHRFIADEHAARKFGWVLLVVNPLDGIELSEEPGAFSGTPAEPYRWTKKLSPTGSYDPETRKPVYDYDKVKGHRAKRIRVWGREAVDDNGRADPAKEQFHLVAYPFDTKQENPAHFHPHSVELMIGVHGTTDVYTRAKRWVSKKDDIPDEGWATERAEGRLRSGDTAIVALGDIHRYVNRSEVETSIVLALQTPQPIMHTLEHETNF
jgi:quercetin dioxygenase-like cupin family protein